MCRAITENKDSYYVNINCSHGKGYNVSDLYLHMIFFDIIYFSFIIHIYCGNQVTVDIFLKADSNCN